MCWRMCEKVSVCSHDITQWLMTNTQCMKSGGSGGETSGQGWLYELVCCLVCHNYPNCITVQHRGAQATAPSPLSQCLIFCTTQKNSGETGTGAAALMPPGPEYLARARSITCIATLDSDQWSYTGSISGDQEGPPHYNTATKYSFQLWRTL